MSDSVLYSHLLLPKGHGYPLCDPKPFDDWPLEYRQRGVQIGDVGSVTSDGAFDPIFNICRPADDPLNRFGVPKGFKQIHLTPGDIAVRSQYHRPGSDVSNTEISKRRLDIDAGADSNVFLPVGAGAVVEISAASKEAAVLLLPDGASRTDLRPLDIFLNCAKENGQRWYAFVNGQLGRRLGSGDLYLVTGFDKSTSWSIAVDKDRSGDGRISMRLKAAQVGRIGTSCTWEWESTSSFADSGPRRGPGEEDWKNNQTVFLRGYKIAIPSFPANRWKTSTVVSAVDSKPSNVLSRSSFVPFSQPSGSPNSGGFLRPAPGGAVDDKESVEYFPATVRPYHPASAINEHLLAFHPDVDVAVTHDDQWASVIYPNDEGIPDDAELINRILRRYTIRTSSGGAWLQDSSQTNPYPTVPTESSSQTDLYPTVPTESSYPSHPQPEEGHSPGSPFALNAGSDYVTSVPAGSTHQSATATGESHQQQQQQRSSTAPSKKSASQAGSSSAELSKYFESILGNVEEQQQKSPTAPSRKSASKAGSSSVGLAKYFKSILGNVEEQQQQKSPTAAPSENPASQAAPSFTELTSKYFEAMQGNKGGEGGEGVLFHGGQGGSGGHGGKGGKGGPGGKGGIGGPGGKGGPGGHGGIHLFEGGYDEAPQLIILEGRDTSSAEVTGVRGGEGARGLIKEGEGGDDGGPQPDTPRNRSLRLAEDIPGGTGGKGGR